MAGEGGGVVPALAQVPDTALLQFCGRGAGEGSVRGWIGECRADELERLCGEAWWVGGTGKDRKRGEKTTKKGQKVSPGGVKCSKK